MGAQWLESGQNINRYPRNSQRPWVADPPHDTGPLWRSSAADVSGINTESSSCTLSARCCGQPPFVPLFKNICFVAKPTSPPDMTEKKKAMADPLDAKQHVEHLNEEKGELFNEKEDQFGAVAKTDPAEIALVRKLDWRIMPTLWAMYFLNYVSF
ncbi:hypothetical protein MPH_03878 [Macrophomina phaseolina MS6]|uniref:Major facilitator superfamily domain general substrate transporter n=1 Tax=Macrophomina phaseolina (strain MS6) TaxID=1126212 RepID=K2S1K1_MACPH|nr:hypothetical protein MPH_03878 [Macrophomina phaseolina MS6]